MQQPTSNPVGEPLLDDDRLARIEGQIRRDYPSLPDYCTFISYVQPKMWAKVRGIDVEIPDTAVFAILVTNYRHRDSYRAFQTGEVMDRWQRRDWGHRHDSDVKSDPAYLALKALVPEILDWDFNLRTMMN